MKINEHHLWLGRVVGNLQGLELVLRLFLCEALKESVDVPKAGTTAVKETHLTNWASLRMLVDEYNGQLTEAESRHRVDDRVVGVRNALAHGRLLSRSPDPPVTLYRFGQPKDGTVPYVGETTLTEEWFRENAELVTAQISSVVACARARGHESFPED